MASTQASPRPPKRDHDTFQDLESKSSNSLHPHTAQHRPASPAPSSASELSDVPSDVANSPMVATAVLSSTNTNTNIQSAPSAFAAMNGHPPAPPTKKPKLTFAEKENARLLKEAEKVKLARDKELKEKASAEEKRAAAAEKARKAAEKEAERKVREAAQEEKRAAVAEKKRQKEQDKKKKDDEKKKAEEEKLKKERAQKKLSNFFTIPSTPAGGRRGSVDSGSRTSMSPGPQTSNPDPNAASPQKPVKSVKSHYEKTFPEFFIHGDVRVAKINRFERDEAAIVSTTNTLDAYMLGNRSPGRIHEFDAVTLFHLQTSFRRGKYSKPVREIMELSGDSSRNINMLRKVPLKILSFAEDVRPPYRGTYTSRPANANGMARLARNPFRKDLPDTNYDYDSEAEWVEDEDAENCDSDGEEEEDIEDGEDMSGFLDDENDDMANANAKRMAIYGNDDLQPISTGLCWEDKHKRCTNVKMMPYRMEVILDTIPKSIDPFSTAYWPSTIPTNMDPPRVPLVKKNTPGGNILQPALTKSVKQMTLTNAPTPSSKATTKDTKPKKLLDAKDLPGFLEAVQGSNLTKVGLIEVLKKQFGYPGAAVKNTLEVMCKRVGVKEADKRWVVVEGGEVGDS
ncbi:hypothetical protein HYFRA_00012791 [Hymenoscyphus fraxineus]|uniref:Chromatin assembly factor 1 subunit A n=1 Tax=Hymenoscyphus fraxineus TaxID=746836 RepID=A0A9N9L848_9HELO|nr:hypothetical protein HYFRA_00012791 [Hymenoscyphus fraxineus]